MASLRLTELKADRYLTIRESGASVRAARRLLPLVGCLCLINNRVTKARIIAVLAGVLGLERLDF